MMIDPLLDEYDQVANDCRELIEMEIEQYSNSGSAPEAAFFDMKREQVERMDELLHQLRAQHVSGAPGPRFDRARLNFLQQKFMQILRLDRELEKKLLARRSSGPRMPQMTTERPTSHAASLYQSVSRTQGSYYA